MGRVLIVLVVGSLCGAAMADVLNMGGTRNPDGSWTGLASLEMVTVGNPHNDSQWSGERGGGVGPDRRCGRVDYG